MVGHDFAVHVKQSVLEDGTWHVHVEIVAGFNANFNRIGKQDFLSVGQLCNHVVGARQESGLVEGTRFHHGAGEGSDADKQSGAVEGSSPFEETSTLEGFSLRGFSISVRAAQCGCAFGREGPEGFNGALQSVGRAAFNQTKRLVGGHDGVGFVVRFAIAHVGGVHPRCFELTVSRPRTVGEERALVADVSSEGSNEVARKSNAFAVEGAVLNQCGLARSLKDA